MKSSTAIILVAALGAVGYFLYKAVSAAVTTVSNVPGNISSAVTAAMQAASQGALNVANQLYTQNPVAQGASALGAASVPQGNATLNPDHVYTVPSQFVPAGAQVDDESFTDDEGGGDGSADGSGDEDGGDGD